MNTEPINNGQEGGPWTKEWQPMTTYYEKSMCDIITKDGEQYNCCWPNAGFMNPCKSSNIWPHISKSDNQKREIPYAEVDKVRLTHDPRWQY